ncbi:hypothetical protein OUZ56_001539 [Daphnia magna]|uniref:Uncharacterized protein n=1 Tax=Daphnia magna TaxID=35525 RepID=A0ABR0A3H2_9CRUS|nr:hypothetical protein OUZ56_001539 [Daphnia magna]
MKPLGAIVTSWLNNWLFEGCRERNRYLSFLSDVRKTADRPLGELGWTIINIMKSDLRARQLINAGKSYLKALHGTA